jgi:hypothetical protein
LQVVPPSESRTDLVSSSSRPALRFDDEVTTERTDDAESSAAMLPGRQEGFEESGAERGRSREAGSFTSRGGLFFLVPAMGRLGMASWLVEHPICAEWSIPWLILRAVAARLGPPDDDAVFRCLDQPIEEPPHEVRREVRQWVRRFQRSLRRTARIGISGLVFRPGRLMFTETHIDVMFRLDAVDIRVRRAGLDIDPGWTLWLGRVIHFHYVGDEAYDG